ncbi:alpha/beta hydrolase (plasmid) [Legionella lytica]|uniref:Alpha/beta hydrolase n=1 Tax=Legionella lytica TaxID=96232 RepID=A0ABY4YCE6_9GAMM|nr:alpha/beta hydrolase [Legionella lytica]USQ15309.1 alpha/beta hydrolase [Legionella lytica]
MSATPFENELTKLRHEISSISQQASSCFATASPQTMQLRELADELSFSTYAIKNTICSIQKQLNESNNKISESQKYEAWKLLFSYYQLIDKNRTLIEQIINERQSNNYLFEDALNETKKKLVVIYDLILAMNFTAGHIYRRSLSPIELSKPPLHQAQTKERAVKPGFIDKIITRLCLGIVSHVAQKDVDIADTLKKTLLFAPNDTHNYQLRVDEKTIVQAIEYRNPVVTNQWLIVVGGAGAAYTDMLPIAQELAVRNQYNFLVVDYLVQKPSSFADPVNTILAAARFLLEKKGVKSEDLVLLGHSNGGRIVREAAAQLPGCSVITNNTYTSLEEVIINHVLHASESLKNTGLSLSKHSEEIINAVSTFFEKHHLDKKVLGRLRTALEKTANEYQSAAANIKIPDNKHVAVYVAPATTHDEAGNKCSKSGGDKILFDAIDGKAQAKKAKLADPSQHQQLKAKDLFFSSDKPGIKGVKYKDSPNPQQAGHYTVIKGVSEEDNTHNVIDVELLSLALSELEQLKTYRPLTLREQFAALLDKHDLSDKTEYLLAPAGIELTSAERFLLLKAMTRFVKESAHAELPTQIQLMRLFQASDVAADIISAYEPALNKMIWGDNPSECKSGIKFLKRRLSTLTERSVAPEPYLQGNGSYMSINLANTVLRRLHQYYAKLPQELLVEHMTSEQNKSEKRHRLFSQGVTISDLDLSCLQPNRYGLVRA